MLPYPMSQTRRALIRRALGRVMVEERTVERGAGKTRATVRRFRPPAKTVSFAHLNTPAAADAMRRWQGTQKGNTPCR